MFSLRYNLPIFLIFLLLWTCPILYDANAAAKGYLFFFFSFLGLLGLILRQRKLHVDGVVVPLLVLAGILSVSSWLSCSPAAGLVFVVALLTAVACFLLNRQLALEDKGQVGLVMAAVALGAMLFAGLGAGQFMARLLLGPQQGMYIPYLLPSFAGWRLSGPFGQANFHALLMVVGLCAHGYIYLSISKVHISRLTAWLFPLPVLLLLVNFFLTQSRGGKISLAAVILGLILWLRHWSRKGRQFPCNWRPLVVFCALLVGSFLLTQVLLGNLSPESVQNSRTGSIDNRINNWAAAFLMTADHPFLGVGPDNYRIHLPPYQVQARDWLRFEYEDLLYTRWTHNEILQMLAEGGLLGLAALLWFLVAVGRRLFNVLKSPTIPFERIFLFLALLPFLAQSLLSWPLRFAPLTALFFTLLAFGLDDKGSRWTFTLGARLRGALTCGLLLLVGAGCWLFYWDSQVAALKGKIGERSQLEGNFQRFEILAQNPFTAAHVLTRGIIPLINLAMFEKDVDLAQQLIPYAEKGIMLDGAYWQWYNLARLFLVAEDEGGARTAIKTCLDLNPIFEPGWGFLHYLDVLNVSRATGKSVSDLLPKRMAEQELLNVRYLSPPPQ